MLTSEAGPAVPDIPVLNVPDGQEHMPPPATQLRVTDVVGSNYVGLLPFNLRRDFHGNVYHDDATPVFTVPA